MSDEEYMKAIRVVEVSAKDIKKVEEELNKLHDDGYAVMEVRSANIDLEPYYHIFAYWSPECDHMEDEDDSNPSIGFSPDE